MQTTRRAFPLAVAALIAVCGGLVTGQAPRFRPVTSAMLRHPSPDDWLMFSRTYDAQRHSPLKQVTRANVGELEVAWTKTLPKGVFEVIPVVHDGVMYIALPGAGAMALDAATGATIWEYRREVSAQDLEQARSKGVALWEDLVFYASPDSYLVALDARTGKARWETKTDGWMTSQPFVADDKVIMGRSCRPDPKACYISAHDARTGKEVWRFNTVAADPGDPNSASWAKVAPDKRIASPWGLPGSYDPERKTLYWGVANPEPFPRRTRHGDADGTARTAPADLYSNSTVALSLETGKLKWYYQHLPGDDWDLDYTNERTLIRTRINPNPAFAKWVNPKAAGGRQRDVSVMLGEGGGVFSLDRETGEFLWATPWPYDTPNFLISSIDPQTGRTSINWDGVVRGRGEEHLVCYWNARSYWPTAYHPGTNSLFVPFSDNCTISRTPTDSDRINIIRSVPRPGSDPEKFGGLSKINMETGEIRHIYTGRAPGTGGVLTTAGDLVFWGDVAGTFRAFDAESGQKLWESTLNGPIQTSTITYAAGGRQFVSVATGTGLYLTEGLIQQAKVNPPRGNNEIYAFAVKRRP